MGAPGSRRALEAPRRSGPRCRTALWDAPGRISRTGTSVEEGIAAPRTSFECGLPSAITPSPWRVGAHHRRELALSSQIIATRAVSDRPPGSSTNRVAREGVLGVDNTWLVPVTFDVASLGPHLEHPRP